MASWRRDGYEIDTDLRRVDRVLVGDFLAQSYWAEGIPQNVVDATLEGSLCFGLYTDARADSGGDEARLAGQVGFARVVTDYASFGWLADVFVVDPHRGRGLSKWLVECVLACPDLQGLRRFMLATRDAHGLYERFGFRALGDPAKFMEIARPGLYLDPVNRGPTENPR
jgi:GNAT superfamily N-acetyltransferase